MADTAISMWFSLCGLDYANDDTTVLAEQVALGTSLITMATTHLGVLTNGVTVDALTTTYITAQMAAELYKKIGNNGVNTFTTLGDKADLEMTYSSMIMGLIHLLKKIKTPSDNDT